MSPFLRSFLRFSSPPFLRHAIAEQSADSADQPPIRLAAGSVEVEKVLAVWIDSSHSKKPMAKRVSLFKLLRRELGPQLAAQGYAEVPQSASSRTHILSYFREPSRGSSLGFWFQRDVKAFCVDAIG